MLPNTFALMGEQIQLTVYLGWEGGLYYQGKYCKLDGKDYVENIKIKILSISLYSNEAQILGTQRRPSYA